jgi:hypothetical protein
MSAPRRAVYRALIGGYELLREEGVARDSDLPFICFTDDPTLTSETWQIEVVERRLPMDATRSSRALKILGHPLLDEFDETLWVDNTVALKVAPDALFDEWLGEADVAAPLHSFRASVLAEAEAVIDSGLDDFARVYEQMAHYLSTGGDVLEQNPHWTGMLARRRTPASAAAMTTWWEHVLRYSRRDQLSFLASMRSTGVELRSLPLDNHDSAWHDWPCASGRDHRRLGSGLREALRSPAGRIGELQQATDDLTRAMTETVAHREAIIAELEAALGSTQDALRTAGSDLSGTAHERDVLRAERDAFESEVERLRERLARKERQVRRTRRKLAQQQEAEQSSTPPPSRWRRALRRVGVG